MDSSGVRAVVNEVNTHTPVGMNITYKCPGKKVGHDGASQWEASCVQSKFCYSIPESQNHVEPHGQEQGRHISSTGFRGRGRSVSVTLAPFVGWRVLQVHHLTTRDTSR